MFRSLKYLYIFLILFSTKINSLDYVISQPLKSQAQVSLIDKKTSNINIIYMPPAAEYKYYRTIGDGIKQETESTNNIYRIRTPLIDDPNKQLNLLKRVIDDGKVDVIIISPHNPELIKKQLERAVNMGIVVLIINSDIPDFTTKVHAVVGYNQRIATNKAGLYLIDNHSQKNLNIGILEGSPGYHSTERVKGFENSIKNINNFTILERRDAKWNIEGGFNATLDMLMDNTSINTIFATNDYEILGAISAAKLLGRNDIIFLGNDGDNSALDMINRGKLDGTVNTYPFRMGRISVQVALDILSKRSTGGFVEIPTTMAAKRSTPPHERLITVPKKLTLVSEVPSELIYNILNEVYTPYEIVIDRERTPFVRGLAKLRRGSGDIILAGGYPGVVDNVYFPLWHFGIDSVSALYNRSVMDIFDEKELKNLKIGMLRSYNLDRYLYSDIKIMELNNRDSAFNMLENRRIDVYIDTKSEIDRLIDTKNINITVSDLKQTEFIKIRNYIAFKNSETGRELARIFDEEFPKLIFSGKLKKIYKKWNMQYPF